LGVVHTEAAKYYHRRLVELSNRDTKMLSDLVTNWIQSPIARCDWCGKDYDLRTGVTGDRLIDHFCSDACKYNHTKELNE
jgi:hypothetical protein